MKITLKNKDFDRFIKALIKPRKPNKALLDAVKEITMPQGPHYSMGIPPD